MNEEPKRKKKIAVAVTNRAPYGRLKPILKAIAAHPQLELQVIVAVPVFNQRFFSALRHTDAELLRRSLSWYIRRRIRQLSFFRKKESKYDGVARMVINDGFTITAEIPLFFEGTKPETMVKSVGVGLIELPKIFKRLKPDMVLVNGDRYEMLTVATAAALMNIPIAHVQGGDVSGTIDESVRHAITKLSHLHFPTSDQSKERLFRMGENPNLVFMLGCPTIDSLRNLDLSIDENIYTRNGTGHGKLIDLKKPYVLMLQHPVTTEHDQAGVHIGETLKALEELKMPVLLFAPNIDAGNDSATKIIRDFTGRNSVPVALFKSFTPEDFYRVLNGAAVAVGNSSSFIREGSYLGVPAVLVGNRQQGRERADNVIEVPYDKEKILEALKKQLAFGRYSQSMLYGDGTASKKIADILATVEPAIQKKFID